jgi:GGDEF domain-containing protein
VDVTQRVGTSFHFDDVQDGEFLIRKADKAMYRAKEVGKIHIVCIKTAKTFVNDSNDCEFQKAAETQLFSFDFENSVHHIYL